jgi:AraC-like DNA-binding protein
MPKNPILNLSNFRVENIDANFYSNHFAAHLLKNKKTISTPHSHDFYFCVLFTKGIGIHQIDFNSYEIRPGSVFCLTPGQMHSWSFKGDVDGYIFFHSLSFYEERYTQKSLINFPFYFSSLNSPLIQLNQSEMIKIKPLFESLLDSYKTNKVMRNNKMCSLIDLIYIELSQLSINNEENRVIKSKSYINKLHQLEKLIDLHYINNKLPRFYAHQMNITSKHLNRISKELINKTTSELIIDRVILEAKRLLTYSKNNYTEIARRLGYDDYAYFSRLFKQKSGYSPSKFQEIILKKEVL